MWLLLAGVLRLQMCPAPATGSPCVFVLTLGPPSSAARSVPAAHQCDDLQARPISNVIASGRLWGYNASHVCTQGAAATMLKAGALQVPTCCHWLQYRDKKCGPGWRMAVRVLLCEHSVRLYGMCGRVVNAEGIVS